MGWFFSKKEETTHSYWSDDEQAAEELIQSDCTPDGSHLSALVRHYHVSETADILERQGIRITDAQTERVIQRLRDKYGLGPIDDYNMSRYVSPDEYAEQQEEQRAVNESRDVRDAEIMAEQSEGGGGGFFGWLFGK